MSLDTYGQPESAWLPRATVIVGHSLLVAMAAALLLTPFPKPPRAFPRPWLLEAASLVYWFRATITLTVLLRRRFAWHEAGSVLAGLALYQLGFSWLGRAAPPGLTLWDVLGTACFLLGSTLNTGAEWQRHRFKKDPANRNRLYTVGCFRFIRHPNYLGDILWVLGWAVLTHRAAASLVVLACVTGFVTWNIPHLETYLQSRYGEAYTAWARRTARLVPGLY